jgi:hypothetical protein
MRAEILLWRESAMRTLGAAHVNGSLGLGYVWKDRIRGASAAWNASCLIIHAVCTMRSRQRIAVGEDHAVCLIRYAELASEGHELN